MDYGTEIMDPLQAAGRIPKIAQRSMRDAALAPTRRGDPPGRRLVEAALLGFERSVEREGLGIVERALLFAERDRMVREMSAFASSQLAARLFSLSADRILAGSHAAPFDAVVSDRRGRRYGVVMRRLSKTSGRLEMYRRVREAAAAATQPIKAVVLYDWVSGATRVVPAVEGGLSTRRSANGGTVRLRDAGAQRHDRDLRPRRKMQLGENVRDVIFDGLVA